MAADLSGWVLDYLLDNGIEDAIADIALAAMDGAGALDKALTGSAARRPRTTSQGASAPVGAFLTSLSVQGFRGVGPMARVEFHPSPGLTIIAGRNGSGKSSLAEALEVALTTKTHRWHNTQFSQVWRNLHQEHPSEIEVELAQEDVGRSTVTVAWPQGETSSQAAKITYQREGEKQEMGLASLGWAEPLEMYRPILTYEELGQMLTGRSIDLHKALAKVLGLEEIKDAILLLTERRNTLREPLTRVDKGRKELRQLLATIDDERALSADQLLKKTQPGVGELRALAAGETGVTTVGRTLADIAATTVPAADEVAAAASALREAAARLADLGERGGRLDDLRRGLLEEALEYHDAAGPGPCPVCEEGTLDGAWKARAEAAVAQSSLLAGQHRQANADLKAARGRALHLTGAAAPALTQTDVALATQADALAAWQLWAQTPRDNDDLAEHLTESHSALLQALSAWQAEAAAVASARNDAWTPVANRLSAWIEQYQERGWPPTRLAG